MARGAGERYCAAGAVSGDEETAIAGGAVVSTATGWLSQLFEIFWQ
jgi:hypothetical protein